MALRPSLDHYPESQESDFRVGPGTFPEDCGPEKKNKTDSAGALGL